MSAKNENPEDKNINAKGQQHEETPDTDVGNALDTNALSKLSGGGRSGDARVRRIAETMHVLLNPDEAVPGREGKSGA